MRQVLTLGTLAILIALTAPAVGEVAKQCGAIESEAERLACYDSHFRPGVDAPPPPPAGTGNVEPIRQRDPAAGDTAGRRGLFPRADRLHAESTIVAVRSGHQQKMIFRLANDEIWIQSTARALPIRKGDAVTVSSATVGGYILRTADGVSTRVQRLR